MENTSPLMFDNVDEKYFLALKGKAVGPLTAQELYERVERGEASLLHYIWRDGWQEWKRICDEREFTVLIPQRPPTSSIEVIKKKIRAKSKPRAAATVPPSEQSRTFYLYFNSTQYGPFSEAELEHVLKSRKLGRSTYLWTPGWATWKRMSEIAEYASFFEQVAPPPPTKSKKEKTSPSIRVSKRKSAEATGADSSERRGMPRRPLVARLFMHNDKDVIIAVCRDISIGGMQVLTDRVPGPVGSTVKLNVSPGDPSKVKGFVAEGTIVRHLEDGRGFSFRFTKISDDARKTIQKYITADA